MTCLIARFVAAKCNHAKLTNNTNARFQLMPIIHEVPLHVTDIDETWFSAQEINSLITNLRDEGVDSGCLLRSIGLSGVDLDDPNVKVSARQRISTFRFALHNAKSKSMALDCGSQMTIAHYGLWGYALMCYPTLRESLDFAYEHLRLAGPVMTKSMSVNDEEVGFSAQDTLSLGRLFPFALEMWWSSVYSLLKNEVLDGNFHLNSLSVSYPRPDHWRDYERVFKCNVTFGAEQCEMKFSVDYLRRRPHLANLITANTCQDLCSKMLTSLSTSTPMISKIRNILLTNQGEYPSIIEMADMFNTSPRSFRRHLKMEGSSYQSLLKETRFTLAEEYLNSTDLSIKKIASLICFSDRANFQNAFKKWSGVTPFMFRERSRRVG